MEEVGGVERVLVVSVRCVSWSAGSTPVAWRLFLFRYEVRNHRFERERCGYKSLWMAAMRFTLIHIKLNGHGQIRIIDEPLSYFGYDPDPRIRRSRPFMVDIEDQMV